MTYYFDFTVHTLVLLQLRLYIRSLQNIHKNFDRSSSFLHSVTIDRMTSRGRAHSTPVVSISMVIYLYWTLQKSAPKIVAGPSITFAHLLGRISVCADDALYMYALVARCCVQYIFPFSSVWLYFSKIKCFLGL